MGSVGFILRPLSLACRRWSFPNVSYVVFPLCVCVLISSSCKDTSRIGLEPTLMTLFDINHPFNGPIFKYSHILRYWGLGHLSSLVFPKSWSIQELQNAHSLFQH